MRRLYVILAVAFLAAPANAQEQQNYEQMYRNINAAMAQDSARLGLQVQQLTVQIQQMSAEIQKLKTDKPDAEKK